LKGLGQVSWYEEHQLTLIERRRADLLEQWEALRDAEIAVKSDRAWIFQNGPDVLKKTHGASCQRLADDLEFGSLWGARGEGVDLLINSHIVMAAAAPFLMAKDEAGWLEFCREYKQDRTF
jgi:hypothetical protein